ncbi:hypothetical protein KAH37_07965 [bacterium]|nr:hypothetical protein [bacterium]
MSSIQTAHLEKTPVIALLREIALKELTGISVVKLPNATEYIIHIKNGSIVRITRTGFSMEKELFALLKQSGTVSNEAFVDAEKKRMTSMRRMLDILMDSGAVSLMLYSKIISALMRLLLIDLLYEEKGLFTFQLQEKVKPFHSVKPIAFLSLKRFHEEQQEHKKLVRRIIRDMHNEVSIANAKSLPFNDGLTFFENYLSGNLEFFEFFTSFLFCLTKKRCTLKNNFTGEAISDLLLRLAFRTVTLIAVILFAITITTSASYTEEKNEQEENNCEFCTMFKIQTATNFYEFSFERTAKKDDLLSSGLITAEDFKHYQIIQKQLDLKAEVDNDDN